MQINRNNIAYLCGTISAPGISLHHSYKYVDYYILYLDIKRLSDIMDHIPVIITQDMYDQYLDQLKIGTKINVIAELRSYNENNETGKRHVSVYANACKITIDESLPDRNDVELKCRICKQPNIRNTPNGKRIADLMLMVYRITSKKDYIPAIAWGSVSDLSANITINDTILIRGRFQSRNFLKKISEEKYIEGISYEVSINTLEILNESEANSFNTQKKEGI